MFVKNPEYFLTIVKERNISRAAEKLYLSQPYLSQYLAKLEGDLGVALLDRSRTPLKLTAAGELFHAYLERQRWLERQLESDLRQLQTDKRQTVRVGVATWRGSVLLPDVLPAFSRRYPEVQVALHEMPVPRLEELMAEEGTDFCIMPIPGDTQALTYELILQERVLLAGRRDHPLVQNWAGKEAGEGEKPFDLRLLEQETLILLPPGWRMEQVLQNTFDACGLKPGRTLVTTNTTTAVNLAAAGMGFAFLPETGLRQARQWKELAFFPIGTPPLTCPLAAVYKKNGFLPPAARAFIDLTKEVYRSLDAHLGEWSDGKM